MCARTPSFCEVQSLCEVQVGQLTQVADHFGHVRVFFDLAALQDHACRHVMKDLLKDVLESVRGVALRAIHLEDAIIPSDPY